MTSKDGKAASAQDYLQKAGTVSLEYLNIFKSKLASTVVDTVYMAEGIGKSVLPGNPVTREYEITRHIGSAGPGLLWRLYQGFKKSTKQEATVFVLQKKSLEAYPKKDRDLIVEAFKKGATQLARIKHPRILSLQHQLEESKDSLAFATEPCFCSVANALGNHENMPSPLPPEFTDFKLFEVEIKYGLMQLAEGLSFLHKDVKLLHRNVCPESIVINSNGAWKLAGFELFVNNINDPNDALKFPFKDWDGSVAEVLNPNLDYMAPEYAISSKCDLASDMFSYGMLFFTVYNNGKSLYKCNSNYSTFVNCSEELKKITNSQMSAIPGEVREYLKLLLHINPELRPDASQVMKIPFFDDVAVKTLEYLDSSFQNDNLQKSLFFKSLPQIIDKLPQRVCLQRIIPCLEQEFINPDMIPFVLPNIFLIAEQASTDDYVKYVLPRLKIIFKLQKPVQILLIVLRNMNLILSKTPPTDVKEHILPMVCRSLEAETVEVQELCLNTLPSFANLLDSQSIKHQVIPRIKKLCLESSALSVRVNSLVCVGKLLENLEKWIVLDDVLPILEKINIRDSAVLMAMLGIYKIVLTHPKLGITKDILATRVLPFIIPITIDNNLNMKQFTAYMSLVKDMLNQIEAEQKKKLEQIELMEREKSIIPYTFANAGQPAKASEAPKAPATMMDQLMIGYGVTDTAPPAAAAANTFYQSSGSGMSPSQSSDLSAGRYNATKKEMTLSEKQEMAAQLEKQNEANGFGMTASKSLHSVKKPSSSNVDLLTNDLFDRNLSTLAIKPPPSSSSSSSSSAKPQQSNFDLLTKSPNSGSGSGVGGASGFPGGGMSSSQSFGFGAAANGSGQSMFGAMNSGPMNNNSMNSSMKPAPNYNINGASSNANLGFFGNLALPAPAAPAFGANSSNLMSKPAAGPSPMGMMNQPLVPTKTAGNVATAAASGKKNALDDLADFLG